MTLSGWILILVFTALIVALAKPAGLAMHRLYDPKPLPLERGLLRLCGSDSTREQGWRGYVAAVLVFNIAVSFVTNTNWQWYSGEVAMSHLTQMIGLTVQNFVSAAAGMAVIVAIIRGIARSNTRNLGNFWVDLTDITTGTKPLVGECYVELSSSDTVRRSTVQ